MVPISKHKLTRNVAKHHQFHTKDGFILKNIHELKNKLSYMSDEVFSHHVNKERNDFHNWVRDVHKDEPLANALYAITHPAQGVKAIEKRLKDLTKDVKKRVAVKESKDKRFVNIQIKPLPKPKAKSGVWQRTKQVASRFFWQH